MDIEQRFEKLERQNRRLRLAFIGLVALAAVAVVMGQVASKPASQETQEKVQDEIRARGFVLVDGDGEVRGRMTVDKGRPSLELYDKQGQSRIVLLVSGRGLAMVRRRR